MHIFMDSKFQFQNVEKGKCPIVNNIDLEQIHLC